MDENLLPHLFIKNVHSSQEYSTPPTVNSGDPLPDRDRNGHGTKLANQLAAIWSQHDDQAARRRRDELPVRAGEYVTFFSAPGAQLETGPLDADGAKFLNIKTVPDSNSKAATIFIPDNKRAKVLNKIDKYINQETKSGKPCNQSFIERVENIKQTTIDFLWNGPVNNLPTERSMWCEIWLATDSVNANRMTAEFRRVAELLDIPVTEVASVFPERTILTVKVDRRQIEELIISFGEIAEIRRAEELNSFWLNEQSIERGNWIKDAIRHVTFNDANNYITILDSGINNGHTLLRDALSDQDRLTANINWGINDVGHRGHGTAMAGLALYGSLNSLLEGTTNAEVNHRLESVKLLPPTEEEIQDIEQWPRTTLDAINVATISDPEHRRIYCMAVTGKNQNDFGKPSTWSAMLDKMIFGEEETDKKVFIISGGNVRDEADFRNYFTSNLDLSIESPAQAWNAITIGAYTEKLLPDASTVAAKFQLSPYSRTSSSWESFWPIKPEVVFEGGNRVLLDNGDTEGHDDLELLTTYHMANMDMFRSFNATSAATALASNFMAKVRHVYPNAWPETLRALMIHSAEWTPEMIRQFGIDKNRKTQIQKLLRIAGYGIPNLQKALECSSNYLSFIAEETIQPYKLDGDTKTNEVHYYEFPWPKAILQELGAASVRLKVTLSYFIEPNPGDKGYATKYAYQSCALKFALKTPGETSENFRIRTNKVNIERLRQEQGVEKFGDVVYDRNTGNDRWFFGADNVFKGSIHSNFWEGAAAEVAACEHIAIFPLASGWWKQLKRQNKADSKLRYSLIVSLETPENSEDIYQDIRNQIAAQNRVQLEVLV